MSVWVRYDSVIESGAMRQIVQCPHQQGSEEQASQETVSWRPSPCLTLVKMDTNWVLGQNRDSAALSHLYIDQNGDDPKYDTYENVWVH